MTELPPRSLLPEGAPPRVRITAQSSLEHARRALPEPVDPRAVFVRSLMRSQLRLALICLGGFLALLAIFTLALRVFPEFDSVRLWGVSLSWLLLGFGPYPLILTTALIYARSARRNEQAYRAVVSEHGGRD